MKKAILMATAVLFIAACQDDDKVNTKPVAGRLQGYGYYGGSGAKRIVYQSFL